MKFIGIVAILIIFGVSCSPKPVGPSTSIKIKMPISDFSKRSISSLRKEKATGDNSIFVQDDVNVLDDIDCYTVLLAFSGEIRQGRCIGDTLTDRIRIVSDTVADGGEIVIDNVPTRRDISIYVSGFKLQDPNQICPDLRKISLSQAQDMSRPVLVGKIVKELEESSENTVSIDIAMANASYINGCGDGPLQWSAGAIFGASSFNNSKFGL